MTVQYNKLESRYQLDNGFSQGFFLNHYESVPVHLTSLLEVLIMSPGSIYVYWLIVRHGDSARRYVLEIIFSVLKIIGA